MRSKGCHSPGLFLSRCSQDPVVDTSGFRPPQLLQEAHRHICTEGKQPTSTTSSFITTIPFSLHRRSTFQTLVTSENQLPIWHNSFKVRRQTNHNTERNLPKIYNSTLPHTHPGLYLATQHLRKLVMDMFNQQARRAMVLEALILDLARRLGE